MATRRSGLGRGLGALIPTGEAPSAPAAVVPSQPEPSKKSVPAEAAVASSDVIDLREGMLREVPIESVSPNTYQPRKSFDDAALQPLADSIRELGVLQPLLVRPKDDNTFELIAGERRLRASKKAGMKTVPVIIRTNIADLQSLEEALVENLHRKDLNPIDEAAAYRQLIDDFGMTHETVSKRMGKSRTVVSNLLRLLQLQPKLQKMLIEDRLSEGHARALLGTEDPAFQLQLAERVGKEGLTVRAVEDAVRLRNELAKPQTSERAKSATKNRAPAAVLEWQNRLRDSLDTRVAITSSGRNGKVIIEFADLEDLERIGLIVESGSDFGESEGTDVS